MDMNYIFTNFNINSINEDAVYAVSSIGPVTVYSCGLQLFHDNDISQMMQTGGPLVSISSYHTNICTVTRLNAINTSHMSRSIDGIILDPTLQDDRRVIRSMILNLL